MISKIGVDYRNQNSSNVLIPNNNAGKNSPNFRGGGLWVATLGLMQACERNPMINVAVIDLLSAILPRTFVESLTNWFAGFEALRRESSGLIVNCLTPGFITMGAAGILNRFVMPKKVNMAGCWADSKLIDATENFYTKSGSGDKVADTFKHLLKNIEGTDGKKTVRFSEEFTEAELENFAYRLKKLSEQNLSRKDLEKEVKKISKEISDKTHLFENIKITGEKEAHANNITALMQDTVRFFREYGKAEKEFQGLQLAEFAKKSKKLVRSKSLMGLAIVLPLAASMQYINRKITAKISGTKGAPIYEDFGKEENKELAHKNKQGLLKQKIISMSSMITVGLLSMMKVPSMNMLEFKGRFPSMDQARLISTTTFASRMAAAEDKHELRESTIRDICTFLSLYFLGDYAAKGTATVLEKRTGVHLLNDTKPINKDANALKKFWHWFKDVKLKSSEEVYGKTPADLKKAVNLRSACQLSNLGVSLLLLGLVIPIFTRRHTKKKHAEEMKVIQQQTLSSSGTATKVGA